MVTGKNKSKNTGKKAMSKDRNFEYDEPKTTVKPTAAVAKKEEQLQKKIEKEKERPNLQVCQFGCGTTVWRAEETDAWREVPSDVEHSKERCTAITAGEEVE